jgi:hypothetical protein
MALSPLSNVLPIQQREPDPLPEAAEVLLETGGDPSASMQDGALVSELDNGGVIIDLAPKIGGEKPKSDKFDANLAEELDESTLGTIASDLLRGIDLDDQSRQDWLTQHAEGIKLLGLVLEDSSGTADSSAPLEGMSTVRHPLLLEAVLAFQATARGELLPAAGPVKVRDDRTQKPPMPPQMGHNGGPPLNDNPLAQPAVNDAPPLAPMAAGPQAGPAPVAPMGAPPMGAPAGPAAAPPVAPPPIIPQPPVEQRDLLAEALETDFNHYLTVTAKEYVPDTDRMLFLTGFGGQGVKKVYHCPIRRRPVSESIPIEDFIVSNALTDLGNAQRITHRAKMKPSRLKRMQILGVWRDIPIGVPTQSDQPNAVDQAKADVVGVQPQVQDPKDADYTVYEVYCELVLDEYAPKQFKGKELPLPYRVTIEKDSEKVLEIRRNWKNDDPQCMAKEFFVEFPFVKAFGFYGIGLLHILGNTTKTLTAIWREAIDNGMFANFPGFLYNKGVGRQLTNNFRVAPGQGVGIDAGLGSLRDNVMQLPYRDLGPAFAAFTNHVEEVGSRLGGTAQIGVGEGKQDAPVGTTMALIEQATKPTSAAMKRLHTAQGKEFQLLKDRFQEDPEAFWRFNRKPAAPWQKEQFIKALNDYDLVPVSDPNNPTRLHRMGKAEAFKGMVAMAPTLFKPREAALHYARGMDLGDIEQTMLSTEEIAAQPQQQGESADPAKMADIQQKAQKAQLDAQSKAQTAKTRLDEQAMEMADREADRKSRERIAEMNMRTEQIRAAASIATHSDKAETQERALLMKLLSEHHGREEDRIHDLTKDELAHRRQKELAKEQPKKDDKA